MARWEVEDYWDDADEKNEPPRPSRRPSQNEDESEEPERHSHPPRPLQEQIQGSLYAIPDSDWGFEAEFRDWHPGACARCDVAADLTYCFKGTDARRMRPRYTLLVLQPTPRNNLKKSTALSNSPSRIRLAVVRRLHDEAGWLGAIEEHELGLLQSWLNWFLEQEKEKKEQEKRRGRK
jgi:hypothetical protein